MPQRLLIIHLVSRDALPAKVRGLAELIRPAKAGDAGARPEIRHVILRLGVPRLDSDAPQRAVHVPSAAWLRGRALDRALHRAHASHPSGSVVLHAWGAEAAAAGIRLARGDRPLVIEVGEVSDCVRVLRAASNGCFGLICDSEAVRQRLVASGVEAMRAVVVRPSPGLQPATAEYSPRTRSVIRPPRERCPRGGEGPARRDPCRADLGLDASSSVLFALEAGPGRRAVFMTLWAAMLVQKVRPDLRVIVPTDGAEAESARHLVRSCRHEALVRYVPARFSPRVLAEIADLVAYLPVRAPPLAPLAEIATAARPMCISDCPAVREIWSEGDAWWVRPGDPADAAAALLRALDAPEESAARAARAAARAAAAFSPQGRIAAYLAVWSNLASRRPAGAIARRPATDV